VAITISTAKVCKVNKSLNNLLPIPSTYLPVPTPLLSTRSKNFLYYHKSVDCYKFSFFPRTVPEWNDLPARIVQCKSVDLLISICMNILLCIIICCISALMPLVGFADHNYDIITTVRCICYSVCVVYSTVFFVFVVYCCVVPLTSVPPTTYSPTIHTTHHTELVVQPQWVGSP